jgi:hypothetical protein
VKGLAARAPSGSRNTENTRQIRAEGAKRANPIEVLLQWV